MRNKINVIQLRDILNNAIIHKETNGESSVNIRLDSNYNFYYNFDNFYDPEDLDFLFKISRDFEKLLALNENDEIIENEFDEEYLSSLVGYYSDCIIDELEKN